MFGLLSGAESARAESVYAETARAESMAPERPHRIVPNRSSKGFYYGYYNSVFPSK